MNTFLGRILAPLAFAIALAVPGVAFAAPPSSVVLTSPVDGANLGTLTSPSNKVTLTADALPSSGSAFITSVDFRVNGASVGSDSAAPYSVEWMPTSPGTYTLTAVATDSSAASNNTLQSAPVVVTVAAVRTAAVTSPASNVTIAAGSQLYVRGSATMSDGLVSGLEFILTSLADSSVTSLGTSTSAPFSRLYTFGVTPGAYTLKARATASDGVTTFDSEALPITVATAVGSGPSVTLTAPLSTDVIVAGGAVALSATASDSDGAITSVTFFADGEQIGTSDSTSPYSVTWNPAAVKSYILTAQAADNNSNTRVSNPVSVSVLSSAPTISITAPANNSAGNVGVATSLTATAAASAGTTIASVEFFAAGVSIGVDTVAPYSIVWTPQNTGAVAITARAIDSNGVAVTSNAVTVNVGLSSLPTVSVTAPAAGASIATGATVTFSANAVPAAGLSLANVQFFANGQLVGTDTTSPYGVTWTPTSTGTTILTARATDSINGVTLSNPVVVTIVPASTSLAVSLAMSGGTAIPAGSSRAVTAAVTPTAGIDRVELYYDDDLIATDTAAPYSFVFTAPSAIGPHRLNARVVDATSLAAVSSNLPITITGAVGVLPVIGISTPTTNAFLAPGTSTTVSGSVVDGDGTITGVQVFVNGASLGNAAISGSTWSLAWTTPNIASSVSLTAIATDSSGNAIAALPVSVNISDTNSPAITLSVSPVLAGQTASTTLPSGAVRNFVANVTPAAGRALVRVEFFVDGTKIGEDTSLPYTFRYAAPLLNDGEQSRIQVFSARATDNGGAARDVQLPLLILNPVGEPPTTSMLSPISGAVVVPGTALNLAAIANAVGGTITSVQFYADGSPAGINAGSAVAGAPYTRTFTPTAAGTYTLDAIATDDRGNTAVSNAVTIVAAFANPTIAITAPSPATTARATPNVPLTVTASAQGGGGAAILLVELLVDGVSVAARTTPTAGTNYSFQWTPATAQLGAHVITTRVTDTNSQIATSAPLNVNVATVVGVPPTVTIAVSPSANNLQTASTVNFTANAVANGTGNALTGVEFFLNDVSIGTAAREQTTNVYRLAYNFGRFDFTSITPTVNETTGAVTYPLRLYAIARDSNNNQTVSSTANLVLNPATSTPPTLQLQALSPTTITAGTPFLIAPTFEDLDGAVVAIQLFANGSSAGAALTNPQLGQLLTYNATTAGRFNLYAVATDDTGNTIVSSPAIVVTVTAISAPTTAITRPSDNATVTTVGAPVFLEGTATNAGSTQVPTMQFIATASGGGRTTLAATRVGTTNTYRATWTPTVADTFTLSTQATVGTVSGTSPTSRRVVVTNLQGLGPSVTLAVPNTATTGSTSNFTATASDSDGSVIEVEFFLNRNSIGLAQRDQQTNTWRLTASFAGVPLGAAEVVALARDSSGNVAASPTTTVNVTAASSIGPSITITPSTTNAAFSRQVQLTANARDADGTVTSVQYFANATSLGTSTNAGMNYQVNWTPTQSGIFNLWALATDNSGITAVAATVPVTVRRNNPVLEDAAFILQTYQDIANTTAINAFVFADLDARLGNGTLSRADVVASLVNEPGFVPPVNLLMAYQILMGQWPTPQNYTSLLATARTNFANAIGAILSSPEYFSKYGTVPTVALLNTPTGALPARTFLARLHANAGLNAPSDLDLVRFMNNDSTAGGTLGRGYNVAGLNAALAEFVTNTNANNTTLRRNAQTAALYYQLNRPSLAVTSDQINARVAVLAQLPDPRAVADAALKDILYTYRFVTITKHPEALTVAPRSGVLFSVEAIGAPPLAYQWLLNGAPIAGANEAILSLTNVDASRVGAYTAVVTSSAGSSTSDPATLTLSTAPTRLANISTRGVTAAGSNVLIGGFVVTGNTPTQTRQMLIRVVGPRLGAAPFNLTGFLPNPRLEVYRGTNPVPILTNDNWGTQTGGTTVNAIQQATNRAGAFTLANNSADAVVLATLAPGPYTVLALAPPGTPNASGVVLIEVYDVTTGNAVGPKAANVSTRGQVGTGNNVLIAGFVVNGTVSRRMLIRGAGPTLSRLGVPDVLADPQITLVAQSSGQTLRTNNDWASGDDAAIIASAASAAGAFPFANGSRDAAMIIMLPPGAYTVQLSGVNNTTGVGIVEVYDIDP